MSPGPLSSAHRGGLNFTHTAGRSFNYSNRGAGFYGTRQVSSPINRIYAANRQRFSETPGEDGGSVIALDENESVTVGTSEDGAVSITIGVKPEPEPENGVEVEVEVGPEQRGWRHKMAAAANPDGSVVIEPDMGQQLVVLGDTDTMLVIGEIPASD
jgi:hypothetical protein